MYFKRATLAAIVVSLTLSSCAAVQKLVPEELERNLINGKVGSNGPVLVVKIDDTRQAHPQIGLEDADIVYIEQVEGGLTRLAAVFSSVIPERVGPVRSARISDLDIIAQFGHVAFAYSGAQRKFLPVIAQADLQDLGAQHESSTIYTTDPARVQPYAMVLRADLLMQKIADKNYLIASSKNIGFQFGKKPTAGIPTQKVVINWPAATYGADWSETEGRWLLTHDNEKNLADSGTHLGPTTLIVQMVSITPSIYKDKFGGVTPFSETVGSGKAYVLRDGELFATTWKRDSLQSGTTFTLENGEVMNFAEGQIWIALTDREPIFTSPPTAQTK